MKWFFEHSHTFAYSAIVITACYGIIHFILLWRQLGKRRFRSEKQADAVVNEVRELIKAGDYEAAEEIVKSPKNWYRAYCWLAAAAIERRTLPIGKLRGDIHTRMNHEVLSGLEANLANVDMVVKTEPMLGLMGTVLGMIGAFAKIAETSNPSPQELMHELSVALYCTAMGLISSIPLMMLGTWLRLQIKKLEERTLGQISDTIDDIKNEQAGNG